MQGGNGMTLTSTFLLCHKKQVISLCRLYIISAVIAKKPMLISSMCRLERRYRSEVDLPWITVVVVVGPIQIKMREPLSLPLVPDLSARPSRGRAARICDLSENANI